MSLSPLRSLRLNRFRTRLRRDLDFRALAASAKICRVVSAVTTSPPGLHQASHPLPARNEWGEDRGEGEPIETGLLSPTLLHPMEEREKSRSLMQP